MVKGAVQEQDELLSVKTVAREADVLSPQVLTAIRRGFLHVRKVGGRTLVLRESFVKWKRRLEMKRALRREERVATRAADEKKQADKPGPKHATGEPLARRDGVSR